MSLVFDSSFAPHYGEAVEIAPDIKRITVNNPSPFTFFGTNSYLIGRDTLALIDPGPVDDAHHATLRRAIAGRPVSQNGRVWKRMARLRSVSRITPRTPWETWYLSSCRSRERIWPPVTRPVWWNP